MTGCGPLVREEGEKGSVGLCSASIPTLWYPGSGKEWWGAPVEGHGSLQMPPATLQPSYLLLAIYPKHTWALIQGCVQIILQ